MKTRILRAFAILGLLLLVFGCGGGGGGGGTDDGGGDGGGGGGGTVTAAKLDITSDTFLLDIDSADSATLTIITRDSNNAALAGVVVNLSATAGTLGSAQVTTDATGTAQVKFYSFPETENQVATITASTSGLPNKVLAINLSTATTTGGDIKLDISSDSYLLNTSDPDAFATLTIYTRDADTNGALSGVVVNLSANGGTLEKTSVTTGATGTAKVKFFSAPETTNQVVTITATAAGPVTKQLAITLVAAPITDAAKLDLTTNKTRLNINGDDSATVTIITRDADNAAVGNIIVKLSSDVGFLGAPQVTTNETGTATVNFSPGPDKVAQIATITASAEEGALNKTLEIEFVDNAGPPNSVVLTSDLPAGTNLSLGGQTTITATVTDENGFDVEDGTPFTFAANSGSITPLNTTTTNGVATATFTGTVGGSATITGTAGSPGETVANTLTINVDSGDATTISFVGANPTTVGVKSSGLNETTLLTFQVKDENGANVDGALVDFAITSPLGGGESVSPNQASTASGFVAVTLQSGTVAGAVTVTATINGEDISTTGKVIIVAGIPESNHFSLAITGSEGVISSNPPLHNLPGYSYFGLEDKITAFVADRYSNPVPLNTPVYFMSEAGAMDTDTAFTDAIGQAGATHITQAPLPSTISFVTGEPGISTILAWTEGQEAFIDTNGNGIRDGGETFDDIGEPFIDADDDGVHDASEIYNDANADGNYDGPNGIWDANTHIWTTIHVVWTYASTGAITLTVTPDPIDCPGFAVPDGGSCVCTIEVTDLNGNPVFGGSTLAITGAAGGVEIAPEEFIIPDALLPGLDTTEFQFTINNPAGGASSAVLKTVTLTVPAIAGAGEFTKATPFTVGY